MKTRPIPSHSSSSRTRAGLPPGGRLVKATGSALLGLMVLGTWAGCSESRVSNSPTTVALASPVAEPEPAPAANPEAVTEADQTPAAETAKPNPPATETGVVESKPEDAPSSEGASSTPEGAPAPASTPPPVKAPPKLSAAAEEMVQLAQAQVGDDVMQAYIDSSRMPYHLGAAEIVYLTDLGVSAEIIASMVRHDQELRASAANAQPVVAEPQPAITVEAPQELSEPTAPGSSITESYFYSALAPYGSWLDLPDYGWCWQPSVAVVSPGWRPYCNGGQWLWTDNGWYWRSYYSWGWAPFHYGRWCLNSGYGWVWVPDTCWGPAWVTWRYAPGYCGWAPLPPGCVYTSGVGFSYYGGSVGFTFGFGLSSSCYAFVPTSCFYTARPWTYCVSGSTVNQFYGNTTVINNVVNGNNNTIINRGIGTDAIAAVSRNEVQKVRLSDTAAARNATTIPSERLSRDGSTLSVYRPNLPRQASAPPSNVIQRQEQRKIASDRVVNSEALRSATVAAQSRAVNGRSLATATRGDVRGPTPGPSRAPVSPRSGAAVQGSSSGLASNQRADQPGSRVTRVETPRSISTGPTRAENQATIRSATTSRSSRTTRQEPALATRSADSRRATVVTSPIRTTAPSRTPVYSSPSSIRSRSPFPDSSISNTRIETRSVVVPTRPSTSYSAPGSRFSTPTRSAPPIQSTPRFVTPEPSARSVPNPAPRSSPRSFAPPPSGSFRSVPAPSPSRSFAPSAPSISRSTGPSSSVSSPSRSGGRTRPR